ncbi:glycoside/pentoside/hexuronide:cation symporter, GPH family [Pseudobutyrivibrio sp. ACV-2]|uniref:MFS transporter n=1 Tax=Pseudobutyrivibrio sp. ACV-2 TaxID=1520801 RepID=UPI00089D4302|nr:glycoside-pentoside-hexuronide (GPH):cation symporter [Pseudobutyrivibrio sp. ACV-2]SEA38210.1 glycoside/pentoside/hexuronide:cation symporter, GPH family [Pseudobutyrivibrio sp. ACV-2]
MSDVSIQAATAATTSKRTDPKLAVGYAFGEVGCQMSWYMINNYLTLFYTDIVGLTASAISLIMLIARVWDAINDPMMGSIADRTNTRWGRFRPYIFFAPPFLAIFNVLTFTVWPMQGIAKVIVCLLCYIGTGMAYTAASIAYQALQNVIAIDSRQRMFLATSRNVGASVIGIVLSIVAAPTLLKLSHPGVEAADAQGYFRFAIIMAVALIIPFLICGFICKEKFTEQLHANKGNTEKLGFVGALKEIVKNDQLLMVVLATVLGTICVSGRMGLLTFYIIYVVGDFMHIATFFTVMTIAQLVGSLFLPWGTNTFTKKGYLIILQMVMNVGFLAMFLLPNSGIPTLLAISAVCGFCNSASGVCYGLVGDSLEYGDWKLGRRQEGVAASMLSFGVKIATAICGSAGVLLLAAVGYVPNAEQTEAARQGINAVVNLLPFVIGVISLIPMLFYKLTPAKVEEIRTDLENGKRCITAEK